MNRRIIAFFALLAPIAIWAQGVKIEFFTPSVVHVVKYQGQAVTPESKVIIAKPEDVKLTRKGNTTSSSQLSVKLDEKTVRIVTDVIFGTMMYTYQYSNGLITLSEYAGSMSEIISKEGLPAGVGFIADLFIGSIPNSGDIAKEVTYYLISKAFENNTTEGTEPEGQAAGNPAAETEP